MKEYHRNKNLKILLFRLPYPCRRSFVRMNNQPWPRTGLPVSLTRLVAGLRKALVKHTQTGNTGPGSHSHRYPISGVTVCQGRGISGDVDTTAIVCLFNCFANCCFIIAVLSIC